MITLLRTGAIFLVMTSAACVTADTLANSSDLEIVLGRTSLDGRPMLAMHVRNRSEGPVCILADKLQNPYTSEIEFRLRDARVYRMQLEPSGYIPEPPNGVMRLEPGMSADARYDLITRFRNLGEGRPLPDGLVAQIAFNTATANSDRLTVTAITACAPIYGHGRQSVPGNAYDGTHMLPGGIGSAFDPLLTFEWSSGSKRM